MSDLPAARAGIPGATLAVVAGGVAAALHIGKLPPAVPDLQATLGIGLVQAGFLLSLVQVAGMTLGLGAGLLADTLGLRRTMLGGLVLLSLASALGGAAGAWIADPGACYAALLALRALEGVGFLLAVMPGPGLIRALAPAGADKAAMGLWGAYMPLGVALALLAGPVLIAAAGWPGWWWLLAAASAGAAGWVALAVPAEPRHGAAVPPAAGWTQRVRDTLAAPGPRGLALAFAVYSSQWIAVIGFLPAIYAEAGIPAAWNAVLTAFAAALNIVGNVAGGRLLQAGLAPQRLLRWGFGVLALASFAAFARIGAPEAGWSLPPMLRYLAICLFSLCGGVVPTTLFMLSGRLAPGAGTVSTTVGLMQQASSLGQFLAPPAVAWLAHRVGGWQWTWAVTVACSLLGLVVAARLGRPVSRRSTA